jgi:hypothetical protein
MANIPDAKIIVRLDTKQAEKDLKDIQGRMAKPGDAKGEAGTDKARFGTSEQKTTPTQRMESDYEQEDHGGTRSGFMQGAEKVRRFKRRAQRVINMVDIAYGVATAGAAGAMLVAKAAGAPEAAVNILKAELQSILTGADWFKNEIIGRISALTQTVTDVKQAAIAMQLGGDAVDKETLLRLGQGSFMIHQIENMRTISRDRKAREATVDVLEQVVDAFMGATGGPTQ